MCKFRASQTSGQTLWSCGDSLRVDAAVHVEFYVFFGVAARLGVIEFVCVFHAPSTFCLISGCLGNSRAERLAPSVRSCAVLTVAAKLTPRIILIHVPSSVAVPPFLWGQIADGFEMCRLSPGAAGGAQLGLLRRCGGWAAALGRSGVPGTSQFRAPMGARS